MSELQSILVYSIEDIICDAPSIAEALTASAQKEKTFLSGIAQVYGQLYFSFIPAISETNESYVIVPFLENLEKVDVVSELHQRWHSGFRFIGLIQIEEQQFYAVFGTNK